MAKGSLKLAVGTLRKAKWRSMLTMFGIIVGIVSIITTVSLGEGVKHQVLGQVNRLGNDLVTIRPGTIVQRDKYGTITHVDLTAAYGFGAGSLNAHDIAVVQQTPLVKIASPLSLLSSPASAPGAVYNGGEIIGTNQNFPSLVNQGIAFGVYFSSSEQGQHVAVIGQQVAEQLFQENAPIGMTLSIRGEDFVVRGVFNEFNGSTLGPGIDLNKAIFIPYSISNNLTGGNVPIVRILVRPKKSTQLQPMISELTRRLTAAHGGQDDITILKQDESLIVTNSLLNVLTAFVAGISALSLIVGGIGIMNIMLVSVSERTREIGIRKAVGATNRQIRNQFTIEAAVLSFVGGVIGVILAYLINFILDVTTNLSPVITWQIVVIAVGVAGLVGILFGLAPAIKAARKDPIDALRYE